MKFLSVFIFICISEGSKVNTIDDIDTSIESFPWTVAIQFSFLNGVRHACGGVLVSDIFVLTTASCFNNAVHLFSLFSIRAGIDDISNGNKETEQTRTVSHIIVHPNYTPDNLLNNLALVRVSMPFNIKSLSVSTISLSNLTSLENIDLVTVRWNLNTMIRLQQTTVREDAQCTKNESFDPQTQLCITGVCQNSSNGGPLMVYSNDTQHYELVGIASHCNASTSEGVFIRTAPFTDWILGILKNPPLPPTTLPTRPPITTPTPKPDILGPPIEFRCNSKYACGCSLTPVIFHDDQVQSRIIGGEDAQPHSWPWVVSLQTSNQHFCSGSLVNKEWVLTAAHCMLNTGTVAVQIGVHNRTSFGPVVRGIIQVIIHPDYEAPPRHVNDIALFRLSSPIDFSVRENYAGMACLPPRTVEFDYPTNGTRLSIIGWGRLIHNGPLAQVLRQVRVNKIADNDERCLTTVVNETQQFCAMVDGGGKDSCQGDSGGPIHQWDGDHWTQVGIISFGKKCGEAEYPGVYTRLSIYHEWFESIQNETGPIMFGAQYSTGAHGTANLTEKNFYFVLIFSLINLLF